MQVVLEIKYAIQLDYGLSDTFQISGFYSEADDPLNAQITGFDIRPGNLWKVYGAAARWKFLNNKNSSLALNGSLESWTVGSGGSDSLGEILKKILAQIYLTIQENA